MWFIAPLLVAGLCKLQGCCNLDKLLKLLWTVTFASSVTEVTFLLDRIGANCIKVKLKCCNFCNFRYCIAVTSQPCLFLRINLKKYDPIFHRWGRKLPKLV